MAHSLPPGAGPAEQVNGHYLFIANDLAHEQRVRAEDIAEFLLSRRMWAFAKSAPYRSKFAPGDKALVYLAGPRRRHVIASATVVSESVPLTQVEMAALEEFNLYTMEFKVELKDVLTFNDPIPLGPLVDQLRFIKNKKYYGIHLRMPVVRIEPSDYQLVIGSSTLP